MTRQLQFLLSLIFYPEGFQGFAEDFPIPLRLFYLLIIQPCPFAIFPQLIAVLVEYAVLSIGLAVTYAQTLLKQIVRVMTKMTDNVRASIRYASGALT